MAPIRMLAVSPVDQLGGAEMAIVRLAIGLDAELGWKVTLTSPTGGAVREVARDAGLAWEPLPLGGLTRGRGLRALASYPRVRGLARANDVVYLNGGTSGRLLPALAGLPQRTVLHIHDLVERVPPFWSRADLVFTPVQAVSECMPGLTSVVVGCPIEPAPAPVDPPWTPDGRPVVGFVGRIEPRKAPLELVRAAPALQAAGARVVLVGDDAFESERAYAEQVAREADAAGVERYGWVENAAGLMGALDVLVLPSRAEPFGTVLAEAMNAGTPPVATRVGGLADVVDDGVTGRLVPLDDRQALVDATLEALEHKAAWGEAGRERVRRWHTPTFSRHVAELIAG